MWNLHTSAKRSLLVILLAVLLVAASAHNASATLRSPGSAAAQFYRTYLKLRVRGLPDAGQRKVLWPLLSKDLQALFEAAQREQDKFVHENPDQKPPWCEGDLFSSLFEGAQSFTVGSAKARGNRAEVQVYLIYREGQDTLRWADTLVLSHTKDGWRVCDIVFNGQWAFKTGQSLRNVLRIE